MKMPNLVVWIVTVAILLFAIAYVSQSATFKKQEPLTGKGFAVLELFTSEGCSSCPPADALLARMQKEAGDKPVYILAYHVDYWDRLGWRDIFSSPQFSERQKQYGSWLSADVYTPQLVVNGRYEYVGSNESAIQNAVTKVLKDSASFDLQIEGKLQPNKINLEYKLNGDTDNDLLWVALVQKHAENKVLRGENGGRTLTHVQVVRDLVKFNLKKSGHGTGSINLPTGFNTTDWELIGFVQSQSNGSIKAVTRVVVSK